MNFIDLVKRTLADRSQRREVVLINRRAVEELVHRFVSLDAERRADQTVERIGPHAHLRYAVELCYVHYKGAGLEDTLDVVVETLYKLRQKDKKIKGEGR